MFDRIKNGVKSHIGFENIEFSDLTGSGLAVIFWLYLASVMQPEEYGEIHFFLGIAGLIQVISMIGSFNSVVVLSSKEKRSHTSLFLLSLIPSIISSIIAFIIFSRIDVGLLAISYVIFESVNGLVLGNKFYQKYTKIILIQKISTVVIGISIFHTIGHEGIIFALVLTYVTHMIIFAKEFSSVKMDFGILKKNKEFIVNNYVTQLSGGFRGQIDKIIIAPLLGLSLLGSYSLTLQIYAMLIIISTISFKYFLSQDSSGISSKNLKKIIIVSSVIISICGIVFLPIIIEMLFPKFVDVIDAIKIISIAVVPTTITMIITSKLLGDLKSRYVLIVRIISTGTMIVGFILFGPIFGLIGLVIIHVIVEILIASILVVINKKEYGKTIV